MILVDLKDFKEESGYISGNAVLKARAKADGLHESKLAHFHMGFTLISYPSDAVVFLEEPIESLVSIIDSSRLFTNNIYRHVNSALLDNSSEYDHWDGESIFDLIGVLQKASEQRNLEQLSELVAYRPVALQSPRLSSSVLNKYRCGEEASKTYHFYIDRNGYALIAMPDLKYVYELYSGQRVFDQFSFDYDKVGYYLCSESDLPMLLSMSKNGDFRCNVSKSTGKECYKVDGVIAQKVGLNFKKTHVKVKPAFIKSSIPLNEYGYTADQVKHATEWICNKYYTGTRTLSYISGMSLAQLSEFVDIAAKDGLIESVNETKHPGFSGFPMEPFERTIKGNALVMKKGGKRMTKAALNKQKATIIERYLDAWSHKDKMVLVPSVLGFFGSAINEDSVDYGDLDVFYATLPSLEAKQAIEDYITERPNADPALVYRNILLDAYDEGEFPLMPTSVNDYSSLGAYAGKVARTFLKRKSKLISVHHLNEVLDINANFEVHYICGKKLDKPITDFDELNKVMSKKADSGWYAQG